MLCKYNQSARTHKYVSSGPTEHTEWVTLAEPDEFLQYRPGKNDEDDEHNQWRIASLFAHRGLVRHEFRQKVLHVVCADDDDGVGGRRIVAVQSLSRLQIEIEGVQ